MAALIEAVGLSAFYGETRALFGVDVAVEAGGVTAVLGANGAGKTTLLRALSGMARVSGEIRLAGERFAPRAAHEAARRGLAHVPDGRGTFLELTVEENLQLGAYGRAGRADLATDFRRVYDYFPRLCERCAQQAGTLSGGEQQMLAIGRALMLRPKLLLLDEPSFGLAPLVVADIFRILGLIHREEGVGMLLVEQNASLALALATSAIVLETGRVVLAGPPAELAANEAVRRAYLGY